MTDLNPEQLKKEIKGELIKNEILMSLEDDSCLSLSDIFSSIKKHLKMIFSLTLLVGIISVIYALSLPNYYKSSATVYVFSNDKSSALKGFFKHFNTDADIDSSSASLLNSSLNSDSMSEYIIKRFGIATNSAIFDIKETSDNSTPIYENVLKKYKNLVQIDYDNTKSLIKISVETLSATASAEIVNAYLEKLEKFSAGPQKEKLNFIEIQLDKAKKDLDANEKELMNFQNTNSIYSYEKQISVLINELSLLKNKKNELEFSLAKLNIFLTQNNLNIDINNQIEAEKKELEVINEKIKTYNDNISKLSLLSLELEKLQRNVNIKAKVYSVLKEQHEITKIAEAEEGYQYKVIDYPRIAKLKSKPHRFIFCLLLVFTTFILSISFCVFKDFVNKKN